MTEIVLGPPGTGKTTALLAIVDEELAAGVPPDRIGFVSFTRRAADEAADRAARRFSLDRRQLPWFRTLHSLCFRRLGMSRSDVLEGPRLQEFADYAGVRITGRWSEDGTLTGYETGDRAVFIENLSRVRCRPLREVYDCGPEPGISWHELERVSRCLAAFKSAHGLLDYTDMLDHFVRSGDDLGLEVLLVDEAQDLSALQWRVVGLLARGCRRVVVAGDDDQAIYTWAGADVSHLIGLEGSVRVLDQSWRVPRRVQAEAARVLRRVGHRRPKDWHAREDDGEVESLEDFADADVDGDDVLVLVRNLFVMKRVEAVLWARGVIYEKGGHPSIRPATLDAVRAWESLRRGEAVPVGEVRMAYEFLSTGRGVRRGHKTLPAWHDPDIPVDVQDLRRDGGLVLPDPLPIWHEAMDRMPRDGLAYILAALRRGERTRQRPRVRVQTIHTSKGGEADHVVLLREVARQTHREAERAPDDEARVWYVAVTRARQRLSLVDSPTNLEYRW